MIFGLDEQNKNLKDAASKRIDTTPRTRSSNKLSAKIASSTTSDAPTSVTNKTSVSEVPKSDLKDGVSDPVRGSMEGLMNAPSTLIQPNGTGYLDKNFQTARYRQKTKFEGMEPAKNFTLFKKYGKITNHSSLAAKDSSVEKMNSRLLIEKMFR
jgi:hypothetical protein